MRRNLETRVLHRRFFSGIFGLSILVLCLRSWKSLAAVNKKNPAFSSLSSESASTETTSEESFPIPSSHSGSEEDLYELANLGNWQDMLRRISSEIRVPLSDEEMQKLLPGMQKLTKAMHASGTKVPQAHPLLQKVFHKRSLKSLTKMLHKMEPNVAPEEIESQLSMIVQAISSFHMQRNKAPEVIMQQLAEHLNLHIDSREGSDLQQHMKKALELFKDMFPKFQSESTEEL